jgi:hypothetical protein
VKPSATAQTIDEIRQSLQKSPQPREVCSAESASVEPTKIKPIQIKTGNQYLRKDFIQTAQVRSRDQTTVSFALANLQSTIFHLQ